MGGNSLTVQWLGLCVSIAGATGSTRGQGTKNPQAGQPGQKKKKKSVRTKSHQVEHEIEVTKKYQIEILELKSKITELKILLERVTAYLSRQKKELVNWKKNQ